MENISDSVRVKKGAKNQSSRFGDFIINITLTQKAWNTTRLNKQSSSVAFADVVSSSQSNA